VEESNFTDAEARAAWNEGAAAWEAFVESGADYYRHAVHGPALLSACGPVEGRDVLDLGCGQGFFSRELARRGARVVGVDLSDALVSCARRHEARQPLGVEYRVMSAAEVDRHWEPGSFDLVTACMALQDMADIGAALRSARAVLRPGGRLVFSVPHPCTDTPYREWERDQAGGKLALKVDRYFESGPAVCHWNMPRLRYRWDTPYWRHTLAEWSALVAEARFLIRRLHEPRPGEEQAQQRPELDDCFRVPFFLIFDLVRPDPPSA
jgi:2-polyprenyl-3-methyl-5-hydroxy-6-metoxy-1,4-benzoquinol methylase